MNQLHQSYLEKFNKLKELYRKYAFSAVLEELEPVHIKMASKIIASMITARKTTSSLS